MKGKMIKMVAVVAFYGISMVNAAEHVIGQHDKTFVNKDNAKMDKISIKTGDTINFKNMDPFFHNVFSLSGIKTFDLGSYPQGESKPVVFDKPGKAEVECAIHPQMFLEVEVQ